MNYQARLRGRSLQILRPSRGGGGPLRWQTLIRIPRTSARRLLRPVQGKAQAGVEYKWTAGGVACKVRIHDADPSVQPTPANPRPNALVGWVVRIGVGKLYMDDEGRLHPRGRVRPRSHLFDEIIANATHIPIVPPASFP
jgi:hypothetical protein